MSPLVFAIIEAVPQVLQLVAGVLGLSFSIKGRPNGVPALMTGAFVVMVAGTVLGLVWQFVSLNLNSWSESGHLSLNQIDLIITGVDVPLGIVSALSWLLVAIAVLKWVRRPQQPGLAAYPGPAGYPMPGQQGPVNPQPGYAQPAYPPPGSAPQPGYAQPGYPQPGYAPPGYPQPGYTPPGYPQQPPGQIGG